jgi:hypothetical protein
MATQATGENSKSGVFITPGLVISFAGGTAPNGWLLCQGQAILSTTYPLLFAAIGTKYNSQIDPTTGGSWFDPLGLYFRVPDYRGIQMRGVGTPSGLDAVTVGGYQGQKTASNGLSTSNTEGGHVHYLGNSALRFGVGGGAVGSPFGSLNDGDCPSPCTHIYRSCNFNGQWSNIANAVDGGTNSSGGHGHTLYGENETRPINKGVNFIIKY